MFRKRRGLSAITGGVFVIIVIATAITYTSFSMNQITQLAETVESKQVSNFEKSVEEFDVVKIRIDNNKFNMTIANTGDSPVSLSRLWIENTTNSSCQFQNLI